MKLPFLPSEDEFYIKDVMIGETACILITPKISAHWDSENVIFRSSVWNKETGELVSPSFKKFHNLGEAPDLFPLPSNLNKSSFIEKIDGSTLIVSWYSYNQIIRTRGTVDARQMDNGAEIDLLIEKYPLAFKFHNGQNTFIFEWVTPANRIVVDYKEPDMIFIGAINHRDYSYWTQAQLDYLAQENGYKRPQRYFVKNSTELIDLVTDFQDKEGIVVYYNNDQNMRKVKSPRYLALHTLKNMADSDKAMVDLFMEYQMPVYSDFMKMLEGDYDYEIAQFLIGKVSKICDSFKEYQKFYNHIVGFVDNIRSMPTRKEQALKIQSAYGNTIRSGMAFSILDNKEIDQRKIKQILLQMMAKV